jgi:hypothetical protein
LALTLFALGPVAGGGCSTSSIIETKAGDRVEAHVVGGSPGNVYLLNKEHGRFALPRDDIRDVDLPGNVVAVAGVGLLAVGGLRLWFGNTSCGSYSQTGTCLVNVVPAIAGLLAATWGSYIYFRSLRRYDDTSRPEPDAAMKPRAPRAPETGLPGWRKPDPFADPR